MSPTGVQSRFALDSNILVVAADQDAGTISFWDAMLWATARRAGCSAILSEDFQDGQVLQGVRFIDPFLRKNNAYVEALLGS